MWGGVGVLDEIKAISAQLGLGFGLSLDIFEGRLQCCENRLNEMFKLSEEKDLKVTALEASIQVTRESLEGNNLEQEMKMTSDFAKNEAPIENIQNMMKI